MAGAERYDLILMDIQMPVMDGFAATEEIRNLPGESGKVPIVAMTAHTMKGDREKSLEAGMNDHIGKPIDPESLFAALVRWIEPREGTLPTEDGTEFPPPPSEKVPPLPSLPGVVSAAGLARLGGNRELYEQLLIKFRRDFGAAGEELAHLLNQGIWRVPRGLFTPSRGWRGISVPTPFERRRKLWKRPSKTVRIFPGGIL